MKNEDDEQWLISSIQKCIKGRASDKKGEGGDIEKWSIV